MVMPPTLTKFGKLRVPVDRRGITPMAGKGNAVRSSALDRNAAANTRRRRRPYFAARLQKGHQTTS
jgi:hypothetical protein